MSAPEDEPVHLIEDAETGDRFLVYETDKGPRLDIRYQGETLWMAQAQIAQLFGRDVSTISRHIANVFEEGELDELSSLQKTQTTTGRPAILYSLDMVISVGYRVSSAQATVFRRWATSILVQFARKGFVVDAPRLKQPENADRVAELREIIRDIRSDEANVYRELRRICAMCQDYDGTMEAAREFYQRTQAKLVFAVTSHTPAEIVATRADHKAEKHGPADLAERQHQKDRCRRLQKLSERAGNQRIESAHYHPSRHIRRSAGFGPACCDGRRSKTPGPAVGPTRANGLARRRLRQGHRREATRGNGVWKVRPAAKARTPTRGRRTHPRFGERGTETA